MNKFFALEIKLDRIIPASFMAVLICLFTFVFSYNYFKFKKSHAELTGAEFRLETAKIKYQKALKRQQEAREELDRAIEQHEKNLNKENK